MADDELASEVVETLDGVYRQAGDMRRVAELYDVRVRLADGGSIGCHLSGGIDSSTIVALVRRHMSGELKTFSIGFLEEKFNDAKTVPWTDCKTDVKDMVLPDPGGPC